MKDFFKKVKKNSLFKFFSSVQLAVPLMLCIGTLVAFGTFIESRYNAEYAKLLIYDTRWFDGILALLWLNIFCSTASRFPYKKHHTGFVITHLGMLTLLIGSMITRVYGIDGQLRVAENSKGQSVLLPEIVFEVGSDTFFKKIIIPKGIRVKNKSQLSSVNKQIAPYFEVTKYYPFVDVTQGFELNNQPTSNELGIEFNLKSKFFNTNEWLHSKNRPQTTMGPATIKLVNDDLPKAPAKKIIKSKPINQDMLIILNAKSNSILKSISISDLNKKKLITIQGKKVALKEELSRATVDNNALAEGEGKLNPALELTISKDGKSIREIIYAKFPDFSLNNGDNFGLKFIYKNKALSNQASKKIAEPATRSPNVIEFHYSNKAKPNKINVQLYKNNKLVLKKEVSKNEPLVTPWMGMTLTINAISKGGGMVTKVTPVTPPPKMDRLPPSAIQISAVGLKDTPSTWLVEGQQKKMMVNGDEHFLYYGRNVVNLPFTLYLKNFYKKDYPGTETPISFESHVNINNSNETIVVSMNEPLQRDGYTLYQSSYELNPGKPTASIFSVNKDPGRVLKYLGSLILSLGIIIFTLMKSRLARTSGKQ